MTRFSPLAKSARFQSVLHGTRPALLFLAALVLAGVAIAASPAFVPGSTAYAYIGPAHAYVENAVGHEFGERSSYAYHFSMEGRRSNWDDIEPDVLLIGRKAGRVSYNAKTNTLTMKNMKAKNLDIASGKTVKIVLKGRNRIQKGIQCNTGFGDGGTRLTDDGTRLTISGKGSLTLGKGEGESDGIGFDYYSGTRSYQGAQRKRASRLTILSGTVKLAGCDVNIDGGDLVMAGGKLSASEVSAKRKTSKKGATFGGKITLKGGTLSASRNISATSMKNKARCLKRAKGPLPEGASFIAGGNEYKVIDSFDNVQLVAYGSKAKHGALGSVKFGGASYVLADIAANAFNTKRGKKVETLEVKSELSQVKARAFAGTKSLEKLTFSNNVKTLKTGAFAGAGAKTIAFEGEVGTIERGAFAGATRPIAARFALAIADLKEGAFSGNALTNLSFSNKYEPALGSRWPVSIDKGAFTGATALTSITFETLANIGSNNFTDAIALQKLDCSHGQYILWNGLADLKNLTELHLKEPTEDPARWYLSLSGCGKDDGRSLTVYFHTPNTDKDSNACKAELVKCGLSSNARVIAVHE